MDAIDPRRLDFTRQGHEKQPVAKAAPLTGQIPGPTAQHDVCRTLQLVALHLLICARMPGIPTARVESGTIGHQRNVETTGSPGNGSSSDTAHVQHVNRRSTSGSMKSVQSVMPQTLRNPPLPVLCRDRKPHAFPVVPFGSMGIKVVSNSDWIGTNKAISNLGERNAC